MFTSFLDDPLWIDRSHRGWTTLASFALQTLAFGGLLLLPLLYIQAPPQLQLMAALVAPTPPPAPAVAPPAHTAAASVSNLMGPNLLMPRSIPKTIANLNDAGPPPELPSGPGVPGGTGIPGAQNPVWGGIGVGSNPLPPPPVPVTRPLPVSHMMEGNLIHRVQPEYPPLARQARIQGTVVLRAVISTEGRIENLQVLSGHPLLVPAAMEAVRQWRYRPYSLNDQPVEVETQITVNFTLAGG
ncbi:MAG: energy transducer TonB [Terriglobales bacterium]